MDKLDWEIYGYPGHKWMRISEGSGWSQSHFYARVPEDFDTADVTCVETIWDDDNYYDNVEGYKIYWNDGGEISKFKATAKGDASYWNDVKVLPYSDRNVYELIDPMVRLALKLGIKTDLDDEYIEYEPVKVFQLLDKISTHVDDKLRLIQLIEGKDLLTLLKELDGEKLKCGNLTTETERLSNKVTRLESEITKLQAELKKTRLSESQAKKDVAQLTEEREQYKSDVITKLKETINNM